MYFIWQIKVSDISAKLNWGGAYESREIIDAAEELGYTDIEEKHDTIEADDLDGYRIIIVKQ